MSVSEVFTPNKTHHNQCKSEWVNITTIRNNSKDSQRNQRTQAFLPPCKPSVILTDKAGWVFKVFPVGISRKWHGGNRAVRISSIPSHRILFQKAFGTPTVSLGHTKRDSDKCRYIKGHTRNSMQSIRYTAGIKQLMSNLYSTIQQVHREV